MNFPDEIPVVDRVRQMDSHWFACSAKSDVFKAEAICEGRVIKVATKRFRDQRESRSKLIEEAILLLTLGHPHIITVLGVWSHPESGIPFLVSHLCGNGTVMAYIKKNPGINKANLIDQIAEALKYLHRMLVVHRNIDPSNIFVDDEGKIRLGGFGRAFTIEDVQASFNRNDGNLRYMSPECSDEHNSITPAADIFSFAMTALEILTNRRPFHHIPSDYTVMVKIARGERPSRENNISAMIWAVISRCWEHNPDTRPSMHALSLFFNVYTLLGERNFFITEALGIVGVDARDVMVDARF